MARDFATPNTEPPSDEPNTVSGATKPDEADTEGQGSRMGSSPDTEGTAPDDEQDAEGHGIRW